MLHSETRVTLCAEIDQLQRRAEIEKHLEALGVDAIDLRGAQARLDAARERLRAHDARLEAAAFADALREAAALLEQIEAGEGVRAAADRALAELQIPEGFEQRVAAANARMQLAAINGVGADKDASAYLTPEENALYARRAQLQTALRNRTNEKALLGDRLAFIRDKSPLLRELTSENVRRLAASLKTVARCAEG